ncbi:phytanoyl-CoA dioxygenase family protein [Sandaracinus amylolyticus]|uniref:phytanoyl-CoA dioxygenase family protein n=1 Tax=Sandaracinus amylolyticus TaxID=927083 RepID=UPI001F469557|nr:phytanoyl-CoA dioxygenase family protein [Sandaracinus amylolyticus]UJR83566.1 Hypothetical protein I5071_56340 [Sandaracinus amylolyticus]
MTGAPLSDAQVERFVSEGFVRLDDAFPRALADEGRAILWKETGCDPDDRTTWTRPVVRLGGYAQPPFARAASTPRICAALDQLVGEGRWAPLLGLGTFPIRFPSEVSSGDDGWHIDVSFALPEDDPNDFMGWRANVTSRGRALLMLFLFSDVGEDDAPTRIRVGSHVDLARRLAPAGDRGMTLRELAANDFAESAERPVVFATGPAGTVYLCHPFLVHAAQRHRGTTPRFLAQPPVFPKAPLCIGEAASTPVERAIRDALRTT